MIYRKNVDQEPTKTIYRQNTGQQPVKPSRRKKKRLPLFLSVVLILAVALALSTLSYLNHSGNTLSVDDIKEIVTSHTRQADSLEQKTAEVAVSDFFLPEHVGNSMEKEFLPPLHDVSMETRDGVTYLTIEGHEMVLVNKQYPLPEDYGDGLTLETREALDAMFAAAANDGIYIWVISGFRSYSTQAAIFSRYAASEGEEAANRYSARPGQSEHQTGLAVDLDGSHGGGLSSSFANTPEYAWLCEHAADYGFILRFLPEREWATGYIYEPWHYRYVGVELAQILTESGLSVEEYAGLVEMPHESETE